MFVVAFKRLFILYNKLISFRLNDRIDKLIVIFIAKLNKKTLLYFVATASPSIERNILCKMNAISLF